MDTINPLERYVDYSQGMSFLDAIRKVEETSSTPEGQLKDLILKVATEVRRRNLDDPNCPLWHPADVRTDKSSTGYSLDVLYEQEIDCLNLVEDAFYKSYAPGSSWEYVGTWNVRKQPVIRKKA